MLLVVDDDEETVSKARKAFYRLNILTVGSEYSASFTYMRRFHIDAVLLLRPFSPNRVPDYARRAHERFPDIPVFTLAGHMYDGIPVLDAGDLLIRAPFSPVSIANKIIANLLKSGRGNLGDMIAGGIRNDIRSACVNFYGCPIAMTDTERAILNSLICHFPRPVSPFTLVRESARPDSSPGIRALMQHVCRINGKLTRQVNRRLITYHPGIGYFIRTKKGCFV